MEGFSPNGDGRSCKRPDAVALHCSCVVHDFPVVAHSFIFGKGLVDELLQKQLNLPKGWFKKHVVLEGYQLRLKGGLKALTLSAVFGRWLR